MVVLSPLVLTQASREDIGADDFLQASFNDSNPLKARRPGNCPRLSLVFCASISEVAKATDRCEILGQCSSLRDIYMSPHFRSVADRYSIQLDASIGSKPLPLFLIR